MKKAGPGESSLISSAIDREEREQGDQQAAEPITSTARLISWVEREASQVLNSMNGSSARWFRRDGRSEHRPQRRGHAELDAQGPAGHDHLGERRLVEVADGQHHALGAFRGRRVLHQLQNGPSAVSAVAPPVVSSPAAGTTRGGPRAALTRQEHGQATSASAGFPFPVGHAALGTVQFGATSCARVRRKKRPATGATAVTEHYTVGAERAQDQDQHDRGDRAPFPSEGAGRPLIPEV